MATVEELRSRVAERTDWFHTIDFGQGVSSPGVCSSDYLRQVLRYVELPERLDGKRVLDIGTYDGFFAFECERRGAAEVFAIDVHPIEGRCFQLARDILQSEVKYLHMSVYELDLDRLGGFFDVVLFFGVFYHLRHIIVSLDNIWSVMKPQAHLRVETHLCDNHFVFGDGTISALRDIDPRLIETPLFRFYRKNEANKDDWSNWFGPNSAAVLDCLGSAGFSDAKLLNTWSSRGSFSARKDPSLPREWEIGSYEGTKFQYRPDGTWTVVWHDPGKAFK